MTFFGNIVYLCPCSVIWGPRASRSGRKWHYAGANKQYSLKKSCYSLIIVLNLFTWWISCISELRIEVKLNDRIHSSLHSIIVSVSYCRASPLFIRTSNTFISRMSIFRAVGLLTCQLAVHQVRILNLWKEWQRMVDGITGNPSINTGTFIIRKISFWIEKKDTLLLLYLVQDNLRPLFPEMNNKRVKDATCVVWVSNSTSRSGNI